MQTYEDFKKEITEVCTTLVNDLEVQNEISRIVDYYYNLDPVRLLILIPAVLVRTGRENSNEFSLNVINGWVELTTKNFNIKVS